MVEVGRVGPILEWYRLYRCIAQQSNTHLKLQYSWLSHGDGSIVQGCQDASIRGAFENVAHNSLETVGPSGMQLSRFFAVCSKTMHNLDTSNNHEEDTQFVASNDDTASPYRSWKWRISTQWVPQNKHLFACVISRLFWNCHCHTQKSTVTTTQLYYFRIMQYIKCSIFVNICQSIYLKYQIQYVRRCIVIVENINRHEWLSVAPATLTCPQSTGCFRSGPCSRCRQSLSFNFSSEQGCSRHL